MVVLVGVFPTLIQSWFRVFLLTVVLSEVSMTGSFSAVSASDPFHSPLSVRAEAYNSSSATVQYWSVHYSDNVLLLVSFEFMTRHTSYSHSLPCSTVPHSYTLFYALFNSSGRPVSHLQVYICWFTFTGSSFRRHEQKLGVIHCLLGDWVESNILHFTAFYFISIIGLVTTGTVKNG